MSAWRPCKKRRKVSSGTKLFSPIDGKVDLNEAMKIRNWVRIWSVLREGKSATGCGFGWFSGRKSATRCGFGWFSGKGIRNQVRIWPVFRDGKSATKCGFGWFSGKEIRNQMRIWPVFRDGKSATEARIEHPPKNFYQASPGYFNTTSPEAWPPHGYHG